jgi:hypothetical protein
MSMIDGAEPLPPFPESMTEATLDLIVPIYVIPTPPDPRDCGRICWDPGRCDADPTSNIICRSY